MSQHDNPLVAPEMTGEETDDVWLAVERMVQEMIDSAKDNNPRGYHKMLRLQEYMAERSRNYNECENEPL